MCGIAGIWHLNNKQLEEGKLKRFTDSIKHRGPDGAGYKIFDDVNLGFGHRRLSILDLTDLGKQPMNYADSNLCITYNGEVYNFIEIKKELKTFGYTFYTDSDTEVILAAYHKWGFEAFNKFNGMWAIALYNVSTKKLLLCRDRFGVKPLYYSFIKDESFSFASETYAFKFLDDFNISFNESNLTQSLVNPVLIEGSGNTIFNTIFQVLPGHFVEVDQTTKVIEQKRWFQIPQHYNSKISFAEATEEFNYLFERSLKLRLRSDVPVASALSGGLDSSSVYCKLQEIKKSNQLVERSDGNYSKAFVATFKGTAQDEKIFAEQVINYTNGQVKYIETDFNSIISNIESSCVLFNDITATPISVLSDVYRAMKADGITVSMDGHGVDEMLYGYKSLVGMAINEALYSGDTNYFEDLKSTYLDMFADEDKIDEKLKLDLKIKKLRALYGLDTKIGELKHDVKSFLKGHVFPRKEFYQYKPLALNNWFLRPSSPALKDLTDKKINIGFYDQAEKELAIDFYYRNIPYNMRDFDRAAMQHGIEIRMPFMDYKLVNFCFSLPMKYKVGNGFTKLILREAMKGKMPESIRTRKTKIGMGAPLNDWFNDQLSTYILDQVSSQEFLNSNYWNGKEIKKMVDDNCKNKSWQLNEAQSFWNILNAFIISKSNG